MDKDKDFDIPHACVLRILRSSLDGNVQVTKEAKTGLSKAAGIFVLYLTSVYVKLSFSYHYLYDLLM